MRRASSDLLSRAAAICSKCDWRHVHRVGRTFSPPLTGEGVRPTMVQEAPKGRRIAARHSGQLRAIAFAEVAHAVMHGLQKLCLQSRCVSGGLS